MAAGPIQPMLTHMNASTPEHRGGDGVADDKPQQPGESPGSARRSG